MDHTICPGSKFIRQPKPELFTCASCGEEVEIWSDEISAKCSSCATTVVRDGSMSCIEWCAMARDCVGDDAYNDFRELKATSVRDHLMEEDKDMTKTPLGPHTGGPYGTLSLT